MAMAPSSLHDAPLSLPGRGTPRSLRCRVLQSPLAGVSDRIFRGFVRRWAPDALLFTEMVNATSLELGHGSDKMAGLEAETGPIAVQLFDHRPGAMAEAARRAEGAGAFLVDINMGCPVRKIARKGGGSGLLRDPALACRIVEAVSAAVTAMLDDINPQEDNRGPIDFKRHVAGTILRRAIDPTIMQTTEGNVRVLVHRGVARLRRRISVTDEARPTMKRVP